jgi:hypothetical protein
VKLVDDIGILWKRWSTRIAGVQLVSAVAFWAALPQRWQDAIPNWVILCIVSMFAAAFIGAQSVKQKSLQPDGDVTEGHHVTDTPDMIPKPKDGA